MEMRLFVVGCRLGVFLQREAGSSGLCGFPVCEPFCVLFLVSPQKEKREIWVSLICASDTNYANYYGI